MRKHLIIVIILLAMWLYTGHYFFSMKFKPQQEIKLDVHYKQTIREGDFLLVNYVDSYGNVTVVPYPQSNK